MVRSNSTIIPPPVVKAKEGGAIKFPNVNDVLSGRGGRINNHEGNVHFRTLVAKVKLQYLSRQTKKPDKAVIAANIVDQVRRLDPPGRFLKECPDTGLWYEVGDERARRKAGQALREDGPEIKGEMMVVEEEKHKSKLTQLAYMSGQIPYGPMMPTPYPFPPVMYPTMFTPPMYTPPGQFSMPPSPVPPTFPIMIPYMYPPTMYPTPPAVTTPTVPSPAQTNPNQSTQSQPNQNQTDSNQPAQIQPNQAQNSTSPSSSSTTSSKKTSNSTTSSKNHDNSSKENNNKANKPNKKHVRSKPEEKVMNHLKENIPKHKKPHLDSNNSSQTDITVNSSTLSDTTDMDVDFYEYHQNIQEPIKDSFRPPQPKQSSRRSQWRESLKTNQKSNFFKKATLDDLPSVIAAPTIEEDSKRGDYLSFSDMRSSSSLPAPDPTINAVSTEEARDEMSCRKSLSMTDFDVIETLASMSSITQESLFK